MFETAELGHTIAKTVFNRVVPKLRADLLDVQYRLKENGTFPVIVLISGVRGAGKGETINLLNEWMDPRHILTRAFDTPSDEERDRPPMWRYWRALPPKGKIGILFGSWYTAPIIDRVFRNTGRGDLAQSIEEINRFEKMLADEGALILKFWFHLSKEAQRKRLKALRSDPETRWRVTKRDWDFFGRYDRFYRISEETLRATSTADAPWIVVEGADPPYRSLTVGKALLGAMKKRLDAPARARPRGFEDGADRPPDRQAGRAHPARSVQVASPRKRTRPSSRPGRAASTASRATRNFRGSPSPWRSRAWTRRARAAPSAASPPAWMRATTT